MKNAPNWINLKDKVFGKLLVLQIHTEKKDRQSVWICKCECGNTVKVRGNMLRKGKTKSCGCLRNVRYAWKGYEEISGSYWYAIKYHAKIKNRIFDVTIEQAWNLFVSQNKKCALSGVELNFVKDYRNNKQKQTASLDRIDSKKHYTLDNIQWVHKDINDLKGIWSDDKLISWCHLISKHNSVERVGRVQLKLISESYHARC